MKLNLPVQQTPLPEIQPLVEARITGGMNSYIDPADIPPNQAVMLKNARTSADFTTRAPGYAIFSQTPPDTNPVLLYTQFTRFDGTITYLRFSEDRVDKTTGGAWTQLTGTLSGGPGDRFRFVQTADASTDYFIFTNNGRDPIRVINSTLTAFATLGNAGQYKYICAFFNRIVAANKVDPISPNPVLIAWSGDFNFDEWNPSNDISAGSNPLVEAQSDYADPITGLFAFASVMLILRERSLWIATKRPVASSPFNFQAAFPSVGCDTPNSATQKQNGIVWYDYRTNNVYTYDSGQVPQKIGDPVRNQIRGAITNKDLVYGSFDPVDNTYYLTVPSDTTPVSKIFVFNFSTQSWSIDERADVYGVYPVDGGVGRLTYDDLVGTYNQLNAANATYDAIGATTENPSQVFFGFSDGEIAAEDQTDTNSEEFIWESKVYRVPAGDMMISRIMLLFEPIRTGSMTLDYRRNNGSWVPFKTISFTAVDGRTRKYITKLIRANDFQWRIRSSTGNFKLLEHKIEVSASPEDK